MGLGIPVNPDEVLEFDLIEVYKMNRQEKE